MYHFCCWYGEIDLQHEDLKWCKDEPRVIVFPLGISLDDAIKLVRHQAHVMGLDQESWSLGTVELAPDLAMGHGKPRFLMRVEV